MSRGFKCEFNTELQFLQNVAERFVSSKEVGLNEKVLGVTN